MSNSPTEPMVSIIAAVAGNGVIGAANGLPWRVRADMRHFKASTLGKPLIMGRKTFASTNGALPGRINIVVTRNRNFVCRDAQIADSLDEALEIARRQCVQSGIAEIMIGGGGEIYRQAMDHAARLIITHVDTQVEGDTRFPPIDANIWQAIEERELDPSDGDTASARVIDYRRNDR
jgi:dihydrofolate reductase